MTKGGRKKRRSSKRKKKVSKRKRSRTDATVIVLPKGKPRGRPKGFSKLTRVQSKKQAVYGYAITFSRSYQKATATSSTSVGVGVKRSNE